MHIKPCCHKFSRIVLNYIDQSSILDRSIELISALSLGKTSIEHFNESTLDALGANLQDYLNQRRILEHFFFGRCLETGLIGEAELQGKLTSLKIHNRDLLRRHKFRGEK